MKKIGIYLAYAPEQSITNQGLGRLLAFIIKGAISSNTKVVLAYPKWYEYEILRLCEDHHIDFSQIDTITTSSVPISIKIKNFITKKSTKKKRGFYKFLLKKKDDLFSFIISDFLTSRSITLFIIKAILYLSIIILSLPLIVISFIIKTIFKTILLNNKIIKLISIVKSPLKNLKNNVFAHTTYKTIREQELKILNNKINKNKDIKSWLIPTIFWSEISSIKARKVVVVPDIIMYDYPVKFANSMFDEVNKTLIKTISYADSYITYSNYVKEEHLLSRFDIKNENIAVINHAGIELSSYLKDESDIEILENYQSKHLQKNFYLKNYSLKDMQYILFTSQVRPHKNFLNLIKAYKILLRKEFINIKLITTANLALDNDIWKYIMDNRLEQDVLCISDVSSKVLAALNSRAVCSVNSTLFEGGFPFTFSEAYSVGTPSIMGNIPMTIEQIKDKELIDTMLFDPYSVTDMVKKMKWGIINHKKLFEMQKPLFEKLQKRTWADVSNDYIKVLDNV